MMSMWYHNKIPIVNDVVMCTISHYDGNGYVVTLDEYAEIEGFVQLRELSNKRIRKNIASFLKKDNKHPMVVTSIDGYVSLSLKDLSDEEKNTCICNYDLTTKLYSMCTRLSHFDSTISSDEWRNLFKKLLSEAFQIHPYEIIRDRILICDMELPERYLLVLGDNHVKLFGIKPVTVTLKVMIQCLRLDGNNYVKDILMKINSDHEFFSDKELHENQERCNVSIKLTGLPNLTVTVSAYQKNICNMEILRINDILDGAKFDIIRYNE